MLYGAVDDLEVCLSVSEDQKEETPGMRTRLTQHEVVEVALQIVHFPLRKLAVVRKHIYMSPSAGGESMLGRLRPKRELSDTKTCKGERYLKYDESNTNNSLPWCNLDRRRRCSSAENPTLTLYIPKCSLPRIFTESVPDKKEAAMEWSQDVSSFFVSAI